MATPARRGLPAFPPDCATSLGLGKTLQPRSVKLLFAVSCRRDAPKGLSGRYRGVIKTKQFLAPRSLHVQ